MRLKVRADGRKPPVAIRTEGARAGKDAGIALSLPFARGLPPNGIEVLWSPVKRRVKTWEGEAGMVKRC